MLIIYIVFCVSSKMSEEGYRQRENGIFTRAIHGGFEPQDESTWPVMPSIVVSAVFEQETPGRDREFRYSRIRNPTRTVLEKSLAEIENAKYALCFSSGLGAATTIISLLSSGDHIIAGEELYGGTYRLFKEIFPRMGMQTTFVDTRDPKNIENAMTEKTKLVWIETPTNPILRITDIKSVSEVVHKQEGVLLVVDNTFQTPYFQRPLELGADISMYSLTKYMNGHNDCIMGSISTNQESIYEKLHFLQHALGIIPSPHDCHQLYRSLKTLPLRMEQHMKNGLALAKYLEKQPQVEKVIYAGLI
ncbi:Sulfhydrylase-like protein lolC2 [Gryllus bimaculatus]|nr:Sulfhydrylase-like protein lolC2 [Gryllus bimaculatus]